MDNIIPDSPRERINEAMHFPYIIIDLIEDENKETINIEDLKNILGAETITPFRDTIN